MAQNIPIYIPTYISDAQYNPARVLPRIFFYNGQLECLDWYTADSGNVAVKQTAFPYFDNYNVITGSFPSEGSVSLLFNNEAPVYGNLPTASLFTEYWDTYVGLLYNPTTRLFNCEAIIPLADYIKMELNDIVEWRGNYYHLRAINDYNLSNGECKLQLLGPLLPDILPEILPAIKNTTTTTTVAPTTTTSTTTTPPCAGCRSYTFKATGSGANVDLYWIDCDGTIQVTGGMGDGQEVGICSIASGSYPYYSASVGAGILSSCGATCSCECLDYTQSFASGGNFSYYPCNQAVGIGNPIFGSYGAGDQGTWYCISSGSPVIGLTPLPGPYDTASCSGCATTTTTTTSTTTTTTTQCPCVSDMVFNVTATGSIDFVNCCGDSQSLSITVVDSNYYVDNSPLCFNINTFTGSATYTVVSYGPCCTPTCPTTTTTTSTTTTSTTTTTTSTTTTTTTTTAPPTTTTTTTTQACCQIDVLTNASLDVDINTIDVDGTAVTVTGGSLPNTPGNGTTVCTTITGTVDFVISTFNSVAGQKVTFCDSNGNCECKNLTGTGPSTLTWTDVFIDCTTPPTLIAEDGSC